MNKLDIKNMQKYVAEGGKLNHEDAILLLKYIGGIIGLGTVSPYEYKGYLRPWLEEIKSRLVKKENPHSIALSLIKRGVKSPQNCISGLISSISYLEKRLNLKTDTNLFDTKNYNDAKKDHAWLLRAEGIKYREIGKRLGVSPARARAIVLERGYDASYFMRRTKFTIYSSEARAGA